MHKIFAVGPDKILNESLLQESDYDTHIYHYESLPYGGKGTLVSFSTDSNLDTCVIYPLDHTSENTCFEHNKEYKVRIIDMLMSPYVENSIKVIVEKILEVY